MRRAVWGSGSRGEDRVRLLELLEDSVDGLATRPEARGRRRRQLLLLLQPYGAFLVNSVSERMSPSAKMMFCQE